MSAHYNAKPYEYLMNKKENDMKTKIMAITAAAIMLLPVFGNNASAQVNRKTYINIGWQFNAPLNNNFSDRAQGWGAYLEGGYYLTPNIAAGLFGSFNTNNTYIPRKTYFGTSGALTTDKQNSLFQIPFGATARYRFSTRRIQPYIEAKLGANYAEATEYFSNYAVKEDTWGFYVSPEIGITLYPFYNNNFGLHIAGYYSYSTNSSNYFGFKELNNAGFKLGITF